MFRTAIMYLALSITINDAGVVDDGIVGSWNFSARTKRLARIRNLTEVSSRTFQQHRPVERRSVLHRLEAVVVQVGSATRVVAGACETSVVRALHVDGATVWAVHCQRVERAREADAGA